MTEVRVDRIRIDGSDVSVGAGPPTESRGPAAPPQAGLSWLQRLPLSASILIGVGVTTAAVAIVWVVLSEGSLNPATYLTRGFFLIPVGAGLVIAGVLKHQASRLVIELGRGTADPITETYIDNLRSAIASPSASHTVESLACSLGWSQVDVVKTLGWLQTRGELAEDIDLSSGQFVYSAIPQTHDLNARLRQTSNGI